MKKLLVLLFVFSIFCDCARAEVFKTQIMQEFSTVNPSKTLIVKALSDMLLADKLVVPKGAILNSEVIDVQQPKSWGRNASFSIKLIQYTDLNGAVHKFDKDYIISYRQKMKPNWERQSFSVMTSRDGGKTETGFEISPYDFKLMKESKNFADFLWKDMNKDSMWADGWDLKYKPGEIMYFNY